MNASRWRIWGFALLTSWSVAQAEVPTVSLLDFETATDGRDCSWAVRAIPELLQIQLQGHELQLLDRQLIHAVLREQRMSVAGITEADSIRAAGLLGAQWLVTGRFAVDDGDRFQVTVRLVSVGTLETKIALSREGAYPGGLERALQEMALEIAGAVAPLESGSRMNASAPASGNVEALILFHRGLDIYARGWPAVASVWFGKAYQHDSGLTAAGLWEIKAYAAAGLSFHAELAREIIGEGMPDSAAATDDVAGRLALAVMNPVEEQPSIGGSATVDLATLKSKIEQGVLAVPGVRLVHPEALGAAAAEADLKLSGLVREDENTRYGHWLTADYLLFSRAGPDEQGVIALKLDLVEAASGNMVRREVAGAGIGSDLAVAESVGRLVGGLVAGKRDSAPTTDLLPTATRLDVGLTYGLLPDEISLANQLFALSREPDRRSVLFALSRIYQSLRQERQAAMVARRLIDTLDIHSPDADLDVYETCTWLNLGEDCTKLEEFLRDQPATLAAILIQYGRCYQRWIHGDEEVALRNLDAVIDGLFLATFEDEIRLFGTSGRVVQHALAGCYYMRGKTQLDQGKAGQARADFQVALDLARRHPLASRPGLKLNLADRPRMSRDQGKPRWVSQEYSDIGLIETMERAIQRMDLPGPVEDPAPVNRSPVPFVQDRLEEAVGQVETAGETGTRILRMVAEADRLFETGEYVRALDGYRVALQEADAFERPLPVGTYGVRKRTKQGGLAVIVGPRESIMNWSQLDETLIELALQEKSETVSDGVRRRADSLGSPPDWLPSWHDWYNAALRHQAKGEYALAARLHQAALEAGVKEYGWTAGPDHAWVEKLADNYMARDPERRWFNSAYNLALCLVETSPEEAAPWLRMLGYAAGSRSVMLYSHMLENGFQSKGSLRIGEEAAKMLDDLHRAPGSGNRLPAEKEE